MFFPLWSYAQFNGEIPVKNGKVIFEKTILVPKKSDQIQSIVSQWLETEFLPGHGDIVGVDTIHHSIVARVTQSLEMKKGDWSQFVLNMTYTLVVEYKTNQCVLTVTNIRYVEPIEQQTNKNNPAVYTAESIFIDRSYKEAFVSNVIGRIQDATIAHIEDLFGSIEEIL